MTYLDPGYFVVMMRERVERQRMAGIEYGCMRSSVTVAPA